jgi:CPA2 family monovalent cation:H+ antiporter-2
VEHHSLTSLMIVVSAAFLVPIILHKFNMRVLPVVVAEILVGLIIGRSGFDLVNEDPFLELLSLLGFIYLMFLSGVEIDFSFFKRRKKATTQSIKLNPLAVASVLFFAILALSYMLSVLLVALNMAEEPVLMTIIIATISLGVVVPVLKEKRLLDTELGQTLLLVTVISDFVTMIMLAIYISWLSGSTIKMFLLLLFFVLVIGAYFLISRFARGSIFKLLSQGTVQIGTRAVFALILLFVVLSETLGAENILGAFLAGVVVSLIAPQKDFVHRLDSFGYGFLIPIFFVMIGVNMELWSLFTEWKVALLIPMLLLFIFISKMVPALILRSYYGWKETIGSGVLLASTLSLVIAASTIAHELGLIDDATHGAFILVAVLSCLIFPIWFNKIFPDQPRAGRQTVGIVGANHITLPVTQGLDQEGYEVRLYSTDKQEPKAGERVSSVEVSALNIEALENQGTFDTDVVVLGSMDDELNVSLARHAKVRGVKRIIVRIEDPQLQNRTRGEGFTVFSTLYAATTLLKAVIENPSAVEFITQHDETIKEAVVGNPKYHEVELRHLPYLGDILVLRIYREATFIIPHGNTEIRLGDRLLVSGDSMAVFALKQEME